MDFIGSIKRPFSDIKKWLIGCILYIIPIVNFLAMGYILEAGVLSLKKKKILPEWEDWGVLFVKGLLQFVLCFIFMLPALILLLIGIGASIPAFITAISTGAKESFFAIILTMIPLMIAVIILVLIAMYLLPAAIFNWLKEKRFGAAFNFGVIFKTVFTGSYFAAWIVSGLAGIVITIITAFIPVIGGAIGGFTTAIIAMTLIGEAIAGL